MKQDPLNVENYRQIAPAPWTGRMDGPDDIRIHQVVRLIDVESEWQSEEQQAVLLGFCCEEGVRRNQGRVGAAEGPQALRRAMASMAWHFDSGFQLLDAGDVFCVGEKLEAAQQALADHLSRVLEKRALPIVLGGGHETAWGSYLGLRQTYGPNTQIGIINIDAHFDLRLPKAGPNSGTPFWQMADWCQQHGATFEYCCLGINPTANTRSLFDRAKELQVHFLTTDELAKYPKEEVLQQLSDFIIKQDHLYLTIDLDAFDAAFAPAVSAPASLGLSPQMALPWIELIAASGKLRLCDICELNPTYDIDQRTAKLGASLLYRILTYLQ